MKKQFELLKATRNNVSELINKCSFAELTSIPHSFNNHLAWNAGHLLATQQILIYMASNTPERMESSFIQKYAKGTFPAEVSLDEIDFIRQTLIPSIDQIEQDYEEGFFGEYTTRMTSYGVSLTSVEDAIAFLNIHEAMHFGQIKMIKRLIDQASL